MSQTKIDWTDVTVHPFPGCKKISPGCTNCYAERMAQRLKAMGQPQYQDVVDAKGWTGKVGANLKAMHVPGTGKRVFCQSMGDLFYEGITDEQRDWAFGKMLAQPQHTFQILTKRPERALAYFESVREDQAECGEPTPFPADNIWFGWTAEDQPRMDARTPYGLQVPAAVRFVSLEPLLGPVDLEQAQLGATAGAFIDWVIVDCESGPKRRRCETRWVADLWQQCKDAGVPRFIKQIDIDGQVNHDAERIASELSGYVGRPLCVEDIRQWPKNSVAASADVTDTCSNLAQSAENSVDGH